MTTQEKIAKAAETMKVAAQAFVDRGQKTYTAEIHCACAGKSLAVAQGEEKLTATDAAALFHALYNHSAWRQRFEKAGLFATATKRVSTFEGLMAELDEEGV